MKPFHNLLEKLLQGPCNWSPLNAKLCREWWETPQAWLSINVYYLKLFSENETTLSECSFIPPKLESCHSHWGSIPWHPPQHHKPVSAKSWHRVLTNQTAANKQTPTTIPFALLYEFAILLFVYKNKWYNVQCPLIHVAHKHNNAVPVFVCNEQSPLSGQLCQVLSILVLVSIINIYHFH